MEKNKMETIIIRNETESDYRAVEELTRKAFWNVYAPGCSEHYLVHTMREHEDFVKELDLVVEVDGKIAASILYTKAKLTDENGMEKEILTFGPLSVLPEYQRRGYGKQLMKASFERAAALGFDTIVICGNPENYVSSGFKSCRKFNVSTGDGIYPTALLVKELTHGVLDEKKWIYKESAAYEFRIEEAEEFDRTFEPMEKGYQISQELFYIYSQSQIVE